MIAALCAYVLAAFVVATIAAWGFLRADDDRTAKSITIVALCSLACGFAWPFSLLAQAVQDWWPE